MAETPKQLVRAAAPTTLGTLYTVPSSTTTIVSTIVITNTTSGAINATLKIGGIDLLTAVPVAANTSQQIDNVRQVMSATETIQGLGASSGLNFHISGMEIA